jgi:hypothetical protein
MLNVYPWGVSVNIVRPLAVDRTRVSFLSYVWDPALVDKGAIADLDRVERQDEAAVESVQQGMGSRRYRGGRYAPRHESAARPLRQRRRSYGSRWAKQRAQHDAMITRSSSASTSSKTAAATTAAPIGAPK